MTKEPEVSGLQLWQMPQIATMELWEMPLVATAAMVELIKLFCIHRKPLDSRPGHEWNEPNECAFVVRYTSE